MSLLRGDALRLPLRDASVDLIVTSPPYFALRSYTDGGEHYDGQLGSEATPAAFVDALVEVTRECVRVLKPSGSMWVNLGDSYAGSGGHNNKGIGAKEGRGPKSYNGNKGGQVRAKSLHGLPWRYAIRCIDDLGLILRAEVIWSKPNGLPESVTDRVRRSHEQWFHFTREPRYFSAVDEVREPHSPETLADPRFNRKGVTQPGNIGAAGNGKGVGWRTGGMDAALGKLPGSVRTVATEPLVVPSHLPQHFAAFPSEWPRWIITGWSPSGICVECGEGRRPVVDRELVAHRHNLRDDHKHSTGEGIGPDYAKMRYPVAHHETTITGESCACPAPSAPTRRSVVLDPFAGTGTSPAVADALGRHGIGLDLSADYLRLARWRCSDPKLRAKVLGVDPPPPQVTGQLDLLGSAGLVR